MRFEKGKLYTRLFAEKIDEMFYPDEDNPQDGQFHCRRILQMRWGVSGQPSFGGNNEMTKHGEITAMGDLVEFRSATDNDIRHFLNNWEASITIAKWAANVQKYEADLLPEEKERIMRIASEYA
jgi:hypothetical protein